MIKTGFIGFGSFARLRLSVIQEFDDVHPVGFFDPNVETASALLKKFKTLRELLTCSDAVLISVPPYNAPKLVQKALEHGLHVFCEKPPGVSEKSLSIIKSQNFDLVLAYGFNHRLHDSVIHIKKLIDSGQLGNILWMRGRYGKEVDQSYLKNWRCDKKLNGGGILIDQGIHLLDLMNWLAGGFDFAQAVLSDRYLNVKKVEDNAFINLTSSKNGISCSLHSTITQWRYLFSLEIFCEFGSIVLNGLRTQSGRYGDEVLSINKRKDFENYTDEVTVYESNNSWSREMAAFFNSIKNQQPYPHSSLPEAREIMKLIDNIYKNAVWIRRKK
ncbi:MAG: oxidoreductase [Flavobacteriaceae bacterium]|nr:oxidoreductase [Flavobacteriaceae bacterium]|tara:strand:+ start:2475 stop:3461 length:987 start_codon:yes stop_codon:yes gene_type:complete